MCEKQVFFIGLIPFQTNYALLSQISKCREIRFFVCNFLPRKLWSRIFFGKSHVWVTCVTIWWQLTNNCDNLYDKQDDNYGDDNGCGDKCCSQLAISTVCLSSFPPHLPISPSPVFGHLLYIIKILNVAMIKAFKEKMPTPSFCYEAMKSKSHIVSENRKCNTDPFVFPPIGPNNSHLTVAAWWLLICAEKKIISNKEFRKKDFKVCGKWKTLATLIPHLMQHEP